MAAPGRCLPRRLKHFGIEVRFVDPADPENFRRATDDRTRAYYAESLPNPKLQVFPIKEVADIGRSLGVPLIVDNTAAPLILRPFEHGAAVVVYSATKYIGGHGTSIGGLIIDGGNFPWEEHAERFPTLNQPDPSYHGKIWAEAVKPLGPIAYVLRIRDRAACAMSAPRSARSTPSSSCKVWKRCRCACASTARTPSRWRNSCKRSSQGRERHLPALPDRRGASAAPMHYFRSGSYGALVGFELKDGRDAGRSFIDALKLFYHVANIGDARSLGHPSVHDDAFAAHRRRSSWRPA